MESDMIWSAMLLLFWALAAALAAGCARLQRGHRTPTAHAAQRR